MTTCVSIKTINLTDAALDCAVAKCEGRSHADESLRLSTMSYDELVGEADFEVNDYWSAEEIRAEILERYNFFSPSNDWAQGGLIIEREGIDLYQYERGSPYGWVAEIQLGPKNRANGKGKTPLVAAMRCYVASKLGHQINIPEAL